MKKSLLVVLVGLLCLLFSNVAVASSPEVIKQDIENYLVADRAVNSKYGAKFMKDFELRANAVKSPEEISKVAQEFKIVVMDIQNLYRSLKPNSDEMKPLMAIIDNALGDISASMDDLDAAVKAEDIDKLNNASDKMMRAIDDLNKSEKAIVDLANQQGMKVYQR